MARSWSAHRPDRRHGATRGSLKPEATLRTARAVRILLSRRAVSLSAMSQSAWIFNMSYSTVHTYVILGGHEQ